MKSELEFTVGQWVRLLRRVWDPAGEDYPGMLLGVAGDKLLIKGVTPRLDFPVEVHHENVTDGRTFNVNADEIDPWGGEEGRS